MAECIKEGITVADWLLIAATITGPIAAVQVQKFIERARNTTIEKRALFKSLISTRGSKTHVDHVRALNSIDAVFDSAKGTDPKVRQKWREYLSQLSEEGPETKEWQDRAADRLVELLMTMGAALGYDLDPVHLRKGAYAPRLHENVTLAQLNILAELQKILSGEKPLPMEVRAFPINAEAASRHAELQDLLVSLLGGERALHVTEEPPKPPGGLKLPSP